MPDDLRERLKAFAPAPRRGHGEVAGRAAGRLRPALRAVEVQGPDARKGDRGGAARRPRDRTFGSAGAALGAAARRRGKGCGERQDPAASTSAVEAISRVLEGGEYYARQPPAKGGRRERRADPLLRVAAARPGGRARATFGDAVAAHQSGAQGALRGRRGPSARCGRSGWALASRRTFSHRVRQGTNRQRQARAHRRFLAPGGDRRQPRRGCPVGGVDRRTSSPFRAGLGKRLLCGPRNAWGLYICELQYGTLGYEGRQPVLDQRYVYACCSNTLPRSA